MKNATSPRWVTYAPRPQNTIALNAAKLEQLNFYDIVCDIHNNFAKEARNKKLKLVLNIDLDEDDQTQSDFNFEGNKAQIETILSQLVKNALAQTLEGTIEIFIQAQKDQIIAEVNDTGIGIHPDQKITFVETQYRGQMCKITFVQDPTTSLASIAGQLQACDAKLNIQVKEGKGMKRRLLIPKTISSHSPEVTADYAVAY